MPKPLPFERGILQQACAIPFRLLEDGPQLCLITSSRSGRWGFPKGLIDPGETAAQAALKEAYEEAGVLGRIVGPPLGHYHYRKWEQTLRVVVLSMEVVRTLDSWEEASLRRRCWVGPAKAARLLQRPELRTLLGLALERLSVPVSGLQR